MNTILITGGTDGIGKAAAMQLAKSGDAVTIVGRSHAKGQTAAAEIAGATGAKVTFESVDLTVMANVRAFAHDYIAAHRKLDMLIHSAGVMLPKRLLTPEGVETTFAVQVLARFVLTTELLPLLEAADQGQMLMIAGGGAGSGAIDFDNLNSDQGYNPFRAIAVTSSANALVTLALIDQQPKLRFYNYGPGFVKTGFGKDMPLFMRLIVGAMSPLIAISPDRAGSEVAAVLIQKLPSGFYRRGVKHSQPYPFAQERSNQQRLWQKLQRFTLPEETIR